MMARDFDEEFKCPPAEYRTMQIIHGFEGLGNGIEQIEDNLRKLQEIGVGGIVCNVGWMTKPQTYDGAIYVAQEVLDHPDRYLISEEAWNIFLKGIKKANEMGFRTWLYDEEGYPSGTAGGLTLKNHPEYQARGIFAIKHEGNGRQAIIVNLPEDAEKFVYAHIYPIKDGKIQTHGSHPADFAKNYVNAEGLDEQWVLMAFAEKTMFEGTHSQHNVFSERKYVNILSADAIRRFIRITHDAYARTMKDDLPKIVEAIFTDEPSLMVCYLNTPQEFKYAVIPWEDSLPERFIEMHNYDLMLNLYALFEGISNHEMHVRHHFHQTIGDMISSNFFGLIDQWCEEHGIDSSGHLLLEERIIQHVAFSGNLMACLRKMQSPGVDMLTSKPERIIRDGWFMSPKYAGSVAFLTNRLTVMSETSSHIETSGKISYTLQEMIGTANIQYLLGVNNMTSYYSWSHFYSDKGKEENQDAVYTKSNYAKYNEYIGRLGVMLKGAIHSADIALYYPIESIQAYFLPSTRSLDTGTQPLEAQHIQASLNDTALGLLYKGWDFDFLDACAVLDAVVADGALKFPNGQYRAAIMPSMKVIPAGVLSKLQEFERQGGLLLWVGDLPDLGGSEGEDPIVLREMQKYKSNEKLDTLNEMLERDLETEKEPAEARVFIGHYVREGMNIYYLVNIEPIEISMTIRMHKVDSFRIYDPFDGKILDTAIPANITISGYGGIFIVHDKN